MDSKKETPRKTISRRDFNRLAMGTALAVAAPAVPALADHHEGAEKAGPHLVSDIKSNELLLSQVAYVSASERDEQQCSNCALLIVNEGEYGKCGLFVEGKVPTTAWCTSWVQKREM